MDEPDTKTCTKCGDAKPLDDFPRDGKRKAGRRSDCKTCHCATVKAIYHRDIKASRAANGARQKRYYAADPEKYKADIQAWRKANPGKHKAISRKWALANPEKVREYKRKWEKANPVQRADNVHKRRARIAGVESDGYTRREIFDRDNGHCKHCNIELHYKPYGFEIDHIVPISLGGPDTRANVLLACRSCNRKKAARLEGQIHLPV